MIETVLEAVTGHGDEVEERIYSSVMQLSDNVRRIKQAREAAARGGGGEAAGRRGGGAAT